MATFKNQQESDWLGRPCISYNHLEQLVDELNLSPHIRTALLAFSRCFGGIVMLNMWVLAPRSELLSKVVFDD